MTARNRLRNDLRYLQYNAIPDITAAPLGDNLLLWHAFIFGPKSTPWEGGIFKLELKFTDNYPNDPPNVRFLTDIFHPNVYKDGSICLDILESNWTPAYSVVTLLISLQSFLTDPNTDSPANNRAAELYLINRSRYDEHVRFYVNKSMDQYQHEYPSDSESEDISDHETMK